MFGRHVSDQLAAWLDGEIPARERAHVEEHVAVCDRCRREMEDIQTARSALECLPVVSAPDGLWEAIESAAERPSVKPWFSWKWAAAVASLVILSGVWWMSVTPDRGSWQVVAVEGSPLAGSRKLSGARAVATGQWVETDGSSRARITVGQIGAVQVEPNTSVRLVSADVKEHRLALRNGEIAASISAPPRLFFVDTPAGTAIDLGCEYRLRCDREGAGLLRVTAGWVAFEWKGRESLVPAGASCRTYAGRGPGTPWFEDASETLARAVAQFDSGNSDALSVLLAEARARDTLTLWHLLARAEGQDRVRVYERMAQLAAPPEGVSRDRVLVLDTASLNRWREELAWIW